MSEQPGCYPQAEVEQAQSQRDGLDSGAALQ